MSKVKVKNITTEEIEELCRHKLECQYCPLNEGNVCVKVRLGLPISKEVQEKEVELL